MQFLNTLIRKIMRRYLEFSNSLTTFVRVMKQRVEEIDFLRCVLILLMITFHIVYIGDTYGVAKQFVYTFHMPAFLLVSGYLCNTAKSAKEFLRAMLWIFIPYLVMETGYVVMASLLPIREHIDNLTAGVLLEKLFLHPLGPYWYLHTWVLCSLVYYGAMRVGNPYQSLQKAEEKSSKGRIVLRLLVAIIVCVVLGFCGLMSIPNAFYFMAGAVLKQFGIGFLRAFYPALWAIVPVVLISLFPSQLDRATPGGVAIVYFMTCFLLSLYRFVVERLRRPLLLIGRNTLLLLLFSPIFTALSKLYQPYLVGFDPSGIVFCIVTVTIATLGSLLIGSISDVLHLSPLFFGRKRIIV